MIVLRPQDPWPKTMKKNPAIGVPEFQDMPLTELITPVWKSMVYEQPPSECGQLWLLIGPRGKLAFEALAAERRVFQMEDFRPKTREFFGMKVLFTATDAIEIVREAV